MAGYVLCVTSGESTTWHFPQREKYAVAAFYESIEKNTQLKQANFARNCSSWNTLFILMSVGLWKQTDRFHASNFRIQIWITITLNIMSQTVLISSSETQGRSVVSGKKAAKDPLGCYS